MTSYHVVKPCGSDSIRTMGLSTSVHLIDLGYDGGSGHAPYNEAFVGGIQRLGDGTLQLWGRKEGSGTIYVSSAFSTSLLPTTPGLTGQAMMNAGGYVLFDALFDSAASYALQSLELRKPDYTLVASINFVGSPTVGSQQSQVQSGLDITFGARAGAADYTQFHFPDRVPQWS